MEEVVEHQAYHEHEGSYCHEIDGSIYFAFRYKFQNIEFDDIDNRTEQQKNHSKNKHDGGGVGLEEGSVCSVLFYHGTYKRNDYIYAFYEGNKMKPLDKVADMNEIQNVKQCCHERKAQIYDPKDNSDYRIVDLAGTCQKAQYGSRDRE